MNQSAGMDPEDMPTRQQLAPGEGFVAHAGPAHGAARRRTLNDRDLPIAHRTGRIHREKWALPIRWSHRSPFPATARQPTFILIAR
jgi:hypothetical protein